jgi:hypothetical protein
MSQDAPPPKPPRRPKNVESGESSAAPAAAKAPRARRPRAKLPPHEIGASLVPASQSIAAVRAANPELDQVGQRTLAHIERRLIALERNRSLTAANFGTIGASDYHPELKALLAEHGVEIPGSDVQTATRILSDVVEGRRLHPKRFGNRGESFVLSTTANRIVPIPTSGTGGFTTGNIVMVGVPIHAAYKGAVVYAVNSSTGAWQVLAYCAPDRDPEEISTCCAALYARLDLSAPSAITGTSVAVTSQLMLELAKTFIAPMSLVSGKVAPLAEGRNCPVRVIGPEAHSMVNFTATDSEMLVRRFTAFAGQNSNIVNVANAVNLPAVSSNSTALCAAYPDPQNCFVLSIAPNNGATALANGFVSGFAAGYGTSYTVPISTTAPVFNLRNNTDYLRHMLYGDIEFDWNFLIGGTTTGPNSFVVGIVLDNGGGTTTTVNFTQNITTQDINNTGSFNTRGSSTLAPYRGLMIQDIVISFQSSTGIWNIVLAPNYLPFFRIRFLDVPAETQYLSAVITGAQSGYNLAVGLKVHTEVLLDPAAANATFLDATNDLPYDSCIIPSIIRAHMLMAPSMKNASGPFAAASFIDTFRKIARAGGKVGTAVSHFVPGPLGTAIGTASNLLTNASNVHDARGGLDLIHSGVSRMRNRQMHAVSFGQGASKGTIVPHFFFPAVTDPKDADVHAWAMVPVVSHGAVDNAIKRAFPESDLGYPDSSIVGRSGTLSVLLATLNSLGFSSRPGLYSGEVSDIEVFYTPTGVSEHPKIDEISFDLLPVDESKAKIQDMSRTGRRLLGLFEEGWFNGRSFSAFDPKTMFSSDYDVTFAEVTPPAGYPGRAYRVVARLHPPFSARN